MYIHIFINIHMQCTFADTSVCFCYAKPCLPPPHPPYKGGGPRPPPQRGATAEGKHL